MCVSERSPKSSDRERDKDKDRDRERPRKYYETARRPVEFTSHRRVISARPMPARPDPYYKPYARPLHLKTSSLRAPPPMLAPRRDDRYETTRMQDHLRLEQARLREEKLRLQLEQEKIEKERLQIELDRQQLLRAATYTSASPASSLSRWGNHFKDGLGAIIRLGIISVQWSQLPVNVVDWIIEEERTRDTPVTRAQSIVAALRIDIIIHRRHRCRLGLAKCATHTGTLERRFHLAYHVRFLLATYHLLLRWSHGLVFVCTRFESRYYYDAVCAWRCPSCGVLEQL